MYKKIVDDINTRMASQIDSRCASDDEVRICFLICEIEKIVSLLKDSQASLLFLSATDTSKLGSLGISAVMEMVQNTMNMNDDFLSEFDRTTET